MIKNLLEVDTVMLITAFQGEEGAAIFLDFEAAFPSIAQEYTDNVLRWAGIPANAMNAFNFCYQQSRCDIAVKGQTFKGFPMEAGVRQGCPLSPIVYALVAEVLLDKLELELEDTFIRAYADDTVIVVKDMGKNISKLEELFQEFELISGLKLNMKKSIIIPLCSKGIEWCTTKMNTMTTLWKDMPLQYHAKYLGFMLGPQKNELSWKKTLLKFKSRALMWRDAPSSLFWHARLHNVFVLPTLLFIAQLEIPSAEAISAADEATLTMAKGPGKWV